MTTLTLLRHAAHDRVDAILCGRMPGVTLGAMGRDQAAGLAERLRFCGATRVLTSPLERARETAAPVAATLGCEADVTDELNEIDFGAWTGRSFSSLDADPHWQAWNQERGHERPPGGESMGEAQTRVAGLLARLTKADDAAILVSHGDMIRAAVLWVLGLSLDAYARVDIAPASITTLELWPGGGKVTGLNERVGTGRAMSSSEPMRQ